MNRLLAALMLAAAPAARAAMTFTMGSPMNHPLITALHTSAALRSAVKVELQALAANPMVYRDESRGPAGQFAALLAANKDKLPPGAVAETLGPESAAALEKIGFNADVVDEIRGLANMHDDEDVDRMMRTLGRHFENDERSRRTVEYVVGTPTRGPDDLYPGRGTPGASLKPSLTFKIKTSGPAPTEAAAEFIDRVETGTLEGREAVRLKLKNGGVLTAVQSDKRLSWAHADLDARTSPGNLSLPSANQFRLLALAGAVPRVQLHELGIRPAWIRPDDETYAADYEKGSVLSFMTEAEIDDVYQMRLDQAEIERWKERARTGRPEEKLKYYALLAAFHEGWPAWLVTEKKGRRKP